MSHTSHGDRTEGISVINDGDIFMALDKVIEEKSAAFIHCNLSKID